jgi:flagellar motor protein MotB
VAPEYRTHILEEELLMKQLWRVALATGVFLTGCVSTSTFDKKQAELAACQQQAKSEIEACNNARSELDTKLTMTNQELGAFRKSEAARQRKLDELQNQEQQLRERLSKELTDKNVEIEQLRGQLSVRMLDKIVFKSGSANILPQGMEVLDKLADALHQSETARVPGLFDVSPRGTQRHGREQAAQPSRRDRAEAGG